MRILIFFGLLCAVGCSTTQPSERSLALVHNKFAGYEQTIGNAAYLITLASCVDRDAEAMHQFLSLNEQFRFDAAASEGHAAVLGFLLRHTGDEFFGLALRDCDDRVKKAVWNYLYFDMAHSWSDEYQANADALLRYEYPITFAE